MLTVTDSAKQLLKETLLSQTDDPESGLRLVVEPPGRLSLVLSKEGSDDQVIEHEGTKILLVQPEVAPMVEGITLDVQDTADGPKLIVTGGGQASS